MIGAEAKRLVLTIAIGDEYQKMGQLTHPTIKAYAEKTSADFLCIGEQLISQGRPQWEKFQIFDLLDEYDRILYVDTDLVIRHDCPDLFEMVPSDKIGLFNEAPFTDRRKELLVAICEANGIALPEWGGRYFNAGVMVVSKKHKPLFKKPEEGGFGCYEEQYSFLEQSYLNVKIALDGVHVHELSHRFNHMTCMDTFTREGDLAPYIIHYAGHPTFKRVSELIAMDVDKWREP